MTGKQKSSLTSLGVRIHFEIAVVLISILPMLTLWYLFSKGLLRSHEVSTVHYWLGGIIAALVGLGYLLLRKYPSTIIKLRHYLEDMAKGEIPEEVLIEDADDDVNTIQEYMNAIVGQLKNRIHYVEEEKSILEKQLYQAQQLECMGTLAAGIAHEINSPIQFVGDNTRFLADAVDDMFTLIHAYRTVMADIENGHPGPETLDETRKAEKDIDLPFLEEEIPKAIDQSVEGLHRVSDIVGAMKYFSHMGHDEEKVPSDLNDAILTTITVSRNEWKYVADMQTALDPAPPLVPCLPGEVRQVVLNLIINAAHSISDQLSAEMRDQQDPDLRREMLDAKGTITIATSHDDTWAEIRVTDTGTGIPASIRDKICDPFFTTKGEGKGTGQGLAITQTSIVRHHDGELSFETADNRGTTFLIRLPLVSQDTPAEKR